MVLLHKYIHLNNIFFTTITPRSSSMRFIPQILPLPLHSVFYNIQRSTCILICTEGEKLQNPEENPCGKGDNNTSNMRPWAWTTQCHTVAQRMLPYTYSMFTANVIQSCSIFQSCHYYVSRFFIGSVLCLKDFFPMFFPHWSTVSIPTRLSWV